jgi:hypothetical protein
MVKKIGKMLAVVLAIVVAVSILVGVWYFNYSFKGTFNVTITDKNNKSNIEYPDLSSNTYKAGQTIDLSIWVSGNTNFLLSNQVRLIANDGSVPVTFFSQRDNIGNDGITYQFYPSSQGALSQNSGFRSILTIITSPFAQQSYYTVTVIGIDDSGVTHSDSYSFSLIS